MTTDSKPLNRLIKMIMDHTIVFISALFAIGIAFILWYMTSMTSTLVHSIALERAQLYTNSLEEFRTLYTTEVIVAAKAAGMEITHDYATKPRAIPLPATFSMLLGNRLGGKESGVSSRLYSQYPFPWRESSGGLNNKFAHDAWAALQKNPTQDYYRFEDVDGQSALRYATADVMREGCVDCHNTHPDTPKNDWRIGQLRGILEVVLPIEKQTLLAGEMTQKTLFLLIVTLLVVLSLITFILRRLKITTHDALTSAEQASNANKLLQVEAVQRKKIENELRLLSVTDPLTGLYNRRKFDEAIASEWKRGARNKREIALLMIDIDSFKQYNDNYGHDMGDEALRDVADALKNIGTRSGDFTARLGGEEFVILLPEINLEGAMKVAEKARASVEARAIRHAYSKSGRVITISVGVGISIPTSGSDSVSLYTMADQALYKAKNTGRNCVRASEASNVTSIKK
ncbi:MAG: diguanylate cyclase [Gammaproteobacteria bacterium]|nr:diguanylate cyclase [Gammaproteobacteria bacterium]